MKKYIQRNKSKIIIITMISLFIIFVPLIVYSGPNIQKIIHEDGF